MIEITELEDKYLVLKKEDLNRFFSQFTKGIFTTKEEQRHINKIPFNTVLKEIQAYRKSMGKKDNRYVILNLDDDIDLSNLKATLSLRTAYNPTGKPIIKKVNSIAVALVNAVLKAKENENLY